MMSSNKDGLSLLELIWRQRWPSVERRLRNCPVELDLEYEGLSPLHWACCNDPPEKVLRALLSKDSRRHALEADSKGMTPLLLLLHCSSSFNLGLLQAFIVHAPECISMEDSAGQTVLHYICLSWKEWSEQQMDSEAFQIFSMLLTVDKTLSGRTTAEGETAFDYLWSSHSSSDEHSKSNDFWKVSAFFLDACCPETKGGSFLHQLVSYIHCPTKVLDLMIQKNPEFLRATDGSGNTVLHRAVLRKQNLSIILILLRHDSTLAGYFNLDSKLAIQLSPSWDTSLELLLQYHPQTLDITKIFDSYYPYIFTKLKQHETLFKILKINPSLCDIDS